MSNQSDGRTGFSLIELLCVIAIIAILSLIAIPLYSEHLIVARRYAASNALAKLALELEKYHAEENTYALKKFAAIPLPKEIEKYYTLKIVSTSEEAYKIEAVPLNAQRKKDLCGTLTLNAYGIKGVTGTKKVEQCW